MVCVYTHTHTNKYNIVSVIRISVHPKAVNTNYLTGKQRKSYALVYLLSASNKTLVLSKTWKHDCFHADRWSLSDLETNTYNTVMLSTVEAFQFYTFLLCVRYLKSHHV